MNRILSRDNRTLKEAAALREKKYRDRSGLFLLEGPDPLREALEQGAAVRSLFIRAGTDLEKLGLAGPLARFAPPAYELPGDLFAKLSDTVTSQGVVAVLEKKSCSEEAFFAPPGGCVLVLDRIQDPGNLGTLLRSAEAMGFAGALLIRGCADPWTPKAARAAAGSLLRLPLLGSQSAEQALALLEAHGKTVYCAVMRSAASCFEQPLARDCAIIIGNEGSGASDRLRAAARPLTIPMQPGSESLNAAAAGAILMYESFRQRHSV